MNKPMTIDEALEDPNLLGAAFGDPSTWSTWLATLRAAFGEKLTRAELRAFKSVAGNRKPPSHKVKELWSIVGRGGGKSRMSAAVAVYLACFLKHDLDPGEVGYVLTLAGSRDQAGRVFDYALAFIRKSPILRKLIKSMTAQEIKMTNGVVIAVHSNSFRLIRGRTILACIFDEVAYWRDDQSANPDQEVFRAVKPSLVRTGGMLIGISSPYRQAGLLHARYKDHYGVDDNDVLVVKGGTREFNPTISQRDIDKELLSDPDGARADWLAEFRSDRAALFDAAVIDDAVDYGRPLELPPRSGHRYHCFVDVSAGRHDSFTLCIGHNEGAKGEEVFVADVVRGRAAPFDPRTVAQEFAALAREYGCIKVVGDAFAGEWTAGAFSEAGARYEKSPHPKSQLYLEALPAFNRSAVSIPDHAVMLRELRGLERRTHRSGRDTVDHGTRGSDDYANSLVGALYLAQLEIRRPAMQQGTINSDGFVTWRDDSPHPRLRWVTVTEKEMLTQKAKGVW